MERRSVAVFPALALVLLTGLTATSCAPHQVEAEPPQSRSGVLPERAAEGLRPAHELATDAPSAFDSDPRNLLSRIALTEGASPKGEPPNSRPAPLHVSRIQTEALPLLAIPHRPN